MFDVVFVDARNALDEAFTEGATLVAHALVAGAGATRAVVGRRDSRRIRFPEFPVLG